MRQTIKLNAAGQVDYQQKIILSTVCSMDLRYYPMDKQWCTLTLSSFEFYIDEVTYDWLEGDQIHQNKGNFQITATLPQFDLTKIIHGRHIDQECNPDEHEFDTESMCDLRQMLDMRFEFKREFLATYFTSVLPAQVMVVIAGAGTYITPHAVSARASIGITTILTTLTLIQSVQRSSGNRSYLTVRDVKIIKCSGSIGQIFCYVSVYCNGYLSLDVVFLCIFSYFSVHLCELSSNDKK